MHIVDNPHAAGRVTEQHHKEGRRERQCEDGDHKEPVLLPLKRKSLAQAHPHRKTRFSSWCPAASASTIEKLYGLVWGLRLRSSCYGFVICCWQLRQATIGRKQVVIADHPDA